MHQSKGHLQVSKYMEMCVRSSQTLQTLGSEMLVRWQSLFYCSKGQNRKHHSVFGLSAGDPHTQRVGSEKQRIMESIEQALLLQPPRRSALNHRKRRPPLSPSWAHSPCWAQTGVSRIFFLQQRKQFVKHYLVDTPMTSIHMSQCNRQDSAGKGSWGGGCLEIGMAQNSNAECYPIFKLTISKSFQLTLALRVLTRKIAKMG